MLRSAHRCADAWSILINRSTKQPAAYKIQPSLITCLWNHLNSCTPILHQTHYIECYQHPFSHIDIRVFCLSVCLSFTLVFVQLTIRSFNSRFYFLNWNFCFISSTNFAVIAKSSVYKSSQRQVGLKPFVMAFVFTYFSYQTVNMFGHCLGESLVF